VWGEGEGGVPDGDVVVTVGRVGERPHLGAAAVRVDRRASPLGNPYVLGPATSRGAACLAYAALLAHTQAAGGDIGRHTVVRIGREAGAKGEVRDWDGQAALGALGHLRGLAREGPVRLLCWCAPALCHAWSISQELVCPRAQ